MQTQNQRLLQQITERDDYTTHLVAESVKAKQLQASLQAEKQVLISRMQHVHGAADLHKQRASRLEDQARSYLDQMGKVMDESRKHSSSLEGLKAKAFETEKDLLSTKAALEAAHKGIEDRGHKLAGAQAELDKERFEKRRVQEELEVLSSKLTRLRSHQEGSPPIERLQDDIKHYKAMIKCSVCHDRSKEVVITKCYHLFCGPCIQRNLEIRHRKCPGCGVPFGQSDVRNVYI
jgi:E3 ubiquitin-protein ligase BRE1